MKPLLLFLALVSATLVVTTLREKSTSEPLEPISLDTVVAASGMRPEAYAAVAVKANPVANDAKVVEASIPYPLYPNGHPYRVSGENGLKVVIYQTDDDFADVDAYYRDAALQDDMPRLETVKAYVRYSRSAADDDPWSTSRPGIVVHELGSDAERRAVGADRSARTNIVMRF